MPLAIIGHYEARYRRAYDRARAALRNLQKDRQRAELHELKLERELRKLGTRPLGTAIAVPEESLAQAQQISRNEPEPESPTHQKYPEQTTEPTPETNPSVEQDPGRKAA